MSFLTDTALSHKKAMRPSKFEIWRDSKKNPKSQDQDQVCT